MFLSVALTIALVTIGALIRPRLRKSVSAEDTAPKIHPSFLPGRTFTGAVDFNTQLQTWLQLANGRHHRRRRR
jgi:hypothetical protein